ncbi:hypothetical protein ACFX13_016311 [Malus domestica]
MQSFGGVYEYRGTPRKENEVILLLNMLLFSYGSLDGKTWTNLRAHENDQTICKPGQFASWPVTGQNALLPFRFFRVVLTGSSSTTDASNPWNFCICFLELPLICLHYVLAFPQFL